MPRLDVNLRLGVGAMTLVLFLLCQASSWATAPDDEICDVNADFALGIENYPSAVALHREFLRAHNENALAHYHLGFAYGMTAHTTEKISEYLTAARLGLDKWDFFLNVGLAYLAQN